MSPITIKVNKSLLEYFRESERHSFYDQLEQLKVSGVAPIDPSVHAYLTTKRYKTMVCLYNKDEVEDFYYRLGSGVTSERSLTYRKACIKIQNQLEAYVDQSSVDIWKLY